METEEKTYKRRSYMLHKIEPNSWKLGVSWANQTYYVEQYYGRSVKCEGCEFDSIHHFHCASITYTHPNLSSAMIEEFWQYHRTHRFWCTSQGHDITCKGANLTRCVEKREAFYEGFCFNTEWVGKSRIIFHDVMVVVLVTSQII